MNTNMNMPRIVDYDVVDETGGQFRERAYDALRSAGVGRGIIRIMLRARPEQEVPRSDPDDKPVAVDFRIDQILPGGRESISGTRVEIESDEYGRPVITPLPSTVTVRLSNDLSGLPTASMTEI